MTLPLVAAGTVTLFAAWIFGFVGIHLGDEATPTGGSVWGISLNGIFLGAVLLPPPKGQS